MADELTEAKYRVRQLEIDLRDRAARIRELGAENARLKKAIEINSVGRDLLEARDKEIARLREALGAVQLKIQAAEIENEGTNYPRKEAAARLQEINIQIDAALKEA